MKVNFIVVVLCITTCAIAAPRRLGMTREKDVTESPDNEVTVSVSVDGKDSDAYVPYIRDDSSEWTNSLVSVSFCCVAKDAFTDEDKVRIACQGTGELYEKVNGSYRRVTSREYLCSNIGSKEFVLHGHSISSSIGDGAVSITYTKDAASSSVSYTVYSAVFVTPAGDPVNSPVDSGVGQNEFTYSNDAIGVLSIDLNAQMLPSGASPSSTGNICFEVGDVGDSTKNWCHENPDGRASISGDELSAHVTFRNLPSHNSDFGKKIARVRCEGRVCGEADYEVFFPKNATNHPGGQTGSPNWFHYWKEGNVCGIPQDCVFDLDPDCYGWTIPSKDNIIRIGSAAAYINTGPEYYYSGTLEYGSVRVTGSGKGIQCVAETIQHEKHHLYFYQQYHGVGTDFDGDGLPNSVELKEDGIASCPTNSDTYQMHGGYINYGDQEIRCRKIEMVLTISLYPLLDWANPGCQSKNRFGPHP